MKIGNGIIELILFFIFGAVLITMGVSYCYSKVTAPTEFISTKPLTPEIRLKINNKNHLLVDTLYVYKLTEQ